MRKGIIEQMAERAFENAKIESGIPVRHCMRRRRSAEETGKTMFLSALV
jgi:hypothetical protein